MVGWALAWKFYDRPTVLKRNWSDKVTFGLWDRSVGQQNFGRTKSIIDSSIFHTKEQAVNRVALRALTQLIGRGKNGKNVYAPAVRANILLKLENRNWTRLVQEPKWTRLRGKSENVYSGTRTFWFFRDRSNIKSVYRSTHCHLCPSVSSILASVPISSNFDFPALIRCSRGLTGASTMYIFGKFVYRCNRRVIFWPYQSPARFHWAVVNRTYALGLFSSNYNEP